jgi:hypothetical protein
MRTILDLSILKKMDNVIIYARRDNDYNNSKQKYDKMWKECPIPFVVVAQSLLSKKHREDDESFFIWKINGKVMCKASKVSFELFKEITTYYSLL